MKSDWFIYLCLLTSIGLTFPTVGTAQNQLNPLETEIDKSDPVIPLGYQKRELSTFEVNRIKREMAKLERTAQSKLQQGGNKAFELWYRQLKLARAVGIETEIDALGDVGAIAWQANRGEDLRNIANRLMTIESNQSNEAEVSPSLLKQLASAYEQVRYLEQAIAIYEQILINNKQQQDLVAVEENLQTLGSLHLAQFNYSSAAEIYEQLLAQTQAKSQINSQINVYLETLIDIYDRTGQTMQAINARQRLIETYQATGKANKIPQLKLAIADDYAAKNKTAKAIEAYESAFAIASEQQLLAIADNALNGLAQLYQKKEQQELAISTLNRLLDVQRQSYNSYGLINTYDTLGKIYLKLTRKQRAKQYFQAALELARELNYNINYFNRQIEKLY